MKMIERIDLDLIFKYWKVYVEEHGLGYFDNGTFSMWLKSTYSMVELNTGMMVPTKMIESEIGEILDIWEELGLIKRPLSGLNNEPSFSYELA